MVFVKVRETYDLHTTKNKMTVIAIRTPKPSIIKRNFPGLLMQCKAYRPYAADVRVACASVQPLDPLGVGTGTGDVAPEDVFNPILYKAMSNFGMSQLEARIHSISQSAAAADIDGDTALVDVDTVTPQADEFPIYYGLLSNAHGWKHANPQAGFEMKGLRPLVWEINYAIGDQVNQANGTQVAAGLDSNGDVQTIYAKSIRGGSKPMPMINTTSYSYHSSKVYGGIAPAGFEDDGTLPYNAEQDVPWIDVLVGCIIVPPSRLHELFYRMVVEWTLEFSTIRPIGEIGDWGGLARIGNTSHYQNYSYSSTKEALTGDTETILNKDADMISANVDINKVM